MRNEKEMKIKENNNIIPKETYLPHEKFSVWIKKPVHKLYFIRGAIFVLNFLLVLGAIVWMYVHFR